MCQLSVYETREPIWRGTVNDTYHESGCEGVTSPPAEAEPPTPMLLVPSPALASADALDDDAASLPSPRPSAVVADDPWSPGGDDSAPSSRRSALTSTLPPLLRLLVQRGADPPS